MPEDRRAATRDAGPWIAAAVAAVVAVAAVLVWLFFGRGDGAGSQTFTSDEEAAVNAAGTETANLLTFSRAHFDADFARALAGATANLRPDVTRDKAATLKKMTDGKYDLSAKVTHSALVGAGEKSDVHGYVVLVSLAGGPTTQTQPTPINLQVTVVRQHGKWLADDVSNIGVGSS